MKVAIDEELRLFGPLHTLSMYLDPPDHPTPTPFDSSMGLDCGLNSEQMEASDRMLQSHADLIAPLLSRSVRALRLVRHEGWVVTGVSHLSRREYREPCSRRVRS